MARARTLSLTGNVACNLAGSLTWSACQWLMLVLVAKLGSAGMLGRFSLAFAVTAPVVLFANLQLAAVLATDARDQFAFADYLGLRLVTTALALGAVACLAFTLDARAGAVILLIGLAKCFEAVSDVINGLVQKRERMDRLGVSTALKGLVSVAAIAAGLRAGGSLEWAAALLAAGWLAVLLGFDWRSARRFAPGTWRPRFQRTRLLALAKTASPLGIVILLISLNGNMSRYFVQGAWGENELGYFSAMAYPMVAISGLASIVGASAAPRLARYYAQGWRARYRGLVFRLTAGVAVLASLPAVAAALAGPRILALLYRPEYARHSEAFVWLMAAAAVASIASVLNCALNATRSFYIQIPLFGAVTVTLAVACAVLVPRAGLLGAAWAQLLGMAVQAGAMLAALAAAQPAPETSPTPQDAVAVQ